MGCQINLHLVTLSLNIVTITSAPHVYSGGKLYNSNNIHQNNGRHYRAATQNIFSSRNDISTEDVREEDNKNLIKGYINTIIDKVGLHN